MRKKPTKVNLDICEEKVQRIMQENWSLNIPIKPKLRNYKLYKDKLLLEKYLLLPKHQRSVIAKFRSGSLPLAIETGRYNNISLEIEFAPFVMKMLYIMTNHQNLLGNFFVEFRGFFCGISELIFYMM